MTGTATVWLINPKGRGEKGRTTTMSKTTKAKPARSAAQIAATKKLVALNKARKAGHVKTAAKPKRSYSKAAPKAPAKKVYKRNPLPPRLAHGADILHDNLYPAAMGAGAALGFDLIWGKLPIGDKLRAGNLKYPVKIIGAIGLGMLAEKMLPAQHKHHAVTLARGPLTVILHDFGKDFMAKNYPSLTLAAYEADTLAEIMEEGMTYLPSPQAQAAQQSTMGEALELNGLSDMGYGFAPGYEGSGY